MVKWYHIRLSAERAKSLSHSCDGHNTDINFAYKTLAISSWAQGGAVEECQGKEEHCRKFNPVGERANDHGQFCRCIICSYKTNP